MMIRSYSSLAAALHKSADVTVVRSIREWRELRPRLGPHVAYVPTMGALHAGHTSLVRLARTLSPSPLLLPPLLLPPTASAISSSSSSASSLSSSSSSISRGESPVVVASVFVNPAQFAPSEDLARYPSSFERDLQLLRDAGCTYVFAPSAAEMYPGGIELDVARQRGAFVEVLGKSHQMEGQVRPHFFRGVATVLAKLFNIVQPNRVFFGQKDAQQCVVVRNLVRDLFFPIEVVVGPTVREADGLAMSSRNAYLTAADRQAGTVLFRGLAAAERAFSEQRVRTRADLLRLAQGVVDTEQPRVRCEYLSLAHPVTLEELEEIGADGAILSGAIKTSTTRLIDNMLLGVPSFPREFNYHLVSPSQAP